MNDAERISAIIGTTHMSIRKFSHHVGLNSPQLLYNILHGKNKISNDVAEAITLCFSNINKEWLLTGKGEMYLPEKEKKEEYSNIPSSVINMLKENHAIYNQQITTLLEQQRDLIDIIKNQQDMINYHKKKEENKKKD